MTEMDWGVMVTRDALASAWRLRMEILAAADDPVTRQRLTAVLDAALGDSIEYVTRAALRGRAAAEMAANPDGHVRRTFVKVHGTYPMEWPRSPATRTGCS